MGGHRLPQRDRCYASPVYHDGLIYAVTRKGVLRVIDATNGTVVYRKKLGLKRTRYPSVTLAGNTIYISGEKSPTICL